MSRTDPNELEALSLEAPCDLCKARPTQWCVNTADGRPADYLHMSRDRPIILALNEGRAQATVEILDAAAGLDQDKAEIWRLRVDNHRANQKEPA